MCGKIDKLVHKHKTRIYSCVGFQIVGLPDFRSRLKFRAFATQPLLDHSKSKQVKISDPHCVVFCPNSN